MKVGLIDVDNFGKVGDCFPNLALMKLSAWHKGNGDNVEWYSPLLSGHCDIVYKSKVFSFTEDYNFAIDADRVVSGGSGYCIASINGREYFNICVHKNLPWEIEHIYPDYSLYGITDTAYGFMSRGCPRQCNFCHVKDKEGIVSHKVADLNEFWDGQKNIQLMDPNTLACRDWKDILTQLKESGASVDFNQGIDIRLMNRERAEMIKEIKTSNIHFAFDRYEDREIVKNKLQEFKEISGWNRHKVSVYILCNYNTTIEQDLERIMFVRSLNFSPYVMLYEKYNLPKGDLKLKLQRWVNNKLIFWKTENFSDYNSKFNTKENILC